MRYLTILALVACFACHKEIEPPPSPLDAKRIEGEWLAMIPSTPKWEYSFHDGFMTQKIVDFGVVITSQDYVYATKADTIVINGAGGNRLWIIDFQCDEVVHVIEMGEFASFNKWLKRK